MLEKLDSIDWASLDGCYGSTAEMPHFLRSLLSPVEEIREWAMDEISDAIFHQGSVFDATPLVVPFLFELLESNRVKVKEEIVCLLTALAGCGVVEETNEESRRLIDADLRKEHGITYEESLRRMRESIVAVKSLIAKRFDLLYPYLRNSRDFYVRLSVANALIALPEIAARLRPDLELALKSEKDENVRSVIKLACDIG